MKEFKLPDIGEGIHEGEIVRWLVAEGQAVTEDQPIAEVMTDKATVEITSPYTGSVHKLCAAEGETVLVGATIIEVDDGGGGNGKAEAAAAVPETVAVAEAVVAPIAASAPSAAAATPVVAAPAAATSGPVLATPATRKYAREAGVELRSIAGTGPRGRVTRDDVTRAMQSPTMPPAATPTPAAAPTPTPPAVRTPPPTPGTEERIAVRGLRRKIAEHMALSKRTAAHFTYVEEADVTELVRMRKEAKETAAEEGVKLTYLPFIMKAIVRGLRKFPMLNAMMDDEKDEIVVKHFYNIGIAVDTPDGLIVPVVKSVENRSVLGLAQEISRVAGAAREGKSALDDLRGGTITITNAGNIGGLLATPIINYPEVAIIGIHKIVKRPVVKNDEIVIGEVMYLSISIDHRVVDGADGARFMNEVVRVLENPSLLLLESI